MAHVRRLDFAFRPQQLEAEAAVIGALERGERRQMVCLPTGSGKTFAIALIACHFRRILFIVHRDTLLGQTVDAFQTAGYGNIGLVTANRFQPDCEVVVAMVFSLHSRLASIPRDAFDLVVIDECHYAGSATHHEVISHFEPQLLLGITATPERYNGVPLKEIFPCLSFFIDLAEAIERGFIVRPRAIHVSTEVSLETVARLGSDFNQAALSKAIDVPARNALAAQMYLEHASDRIAIGFCCTVEHSRNVTAAMRDHGIRAEFVTGDDKDRRRKLEAIKAGDIQVLNSIDMLIEGFDAPIVSCALLLRPTRSRPLLVQSCGRALRLYPGKVDGLLLNFIDRGFVDLMPEWDLEGLSVRRPSNADAITPPRGAPVEPNPYASLFRSLRPRNGIEAVRPQKLPSNEPRDPTGPRHRYAADAFAWLFGSELKLEAFIELDDLLLPAPQVVPRLEGSADAWQSLPANDAQRRILREHGYETERELWTRGQAVAAIEGLPATPNERRRLLALGYDTLSMEWSRAQSTAVLAENVGIEPNPEIIAALRTEVETSDPAPALVRSTERAIPARSEDSPPSATPVPGRRDHP